MPTRLSQRSALAPTRILEPKRHSSDQSFGGIKLQIRQRVPQLSISKDKFRNESLRTKTLDQQEKEDGEFYYLQEDAGMPSEAYVCEKNIAKKPSRPFVSKGSHRESMIGDGRLTSAA